MLCLRLRPAASRRGFLSIWGLSLFGALGLRHYDRKAGAQYTRLSDLSGGWSAQLSTGNPGLPQVLKHSAPKMIFATCSPMPYFHLVSQSISSRYNMGRFQVTCINKRGGHFNPHERIEYIGNQAGNWKLSEPNAIGRIKGRSDSFYTLVNGREAECVFRRCEWSIPARCEWSFRPCE